MTPSPRCCATFRSSAGSTASTSRGSWARSRSTAWPPATSSPRRAARPTRCTSSRAGASRSRSLRPMARCTCATLSGRRTSVSSACCSRGAPHRRVRSPTSCCGGSRGHGSRRSCATGRRSGSRSPPRSRTRSTGDRVNTSVRPHRSGPNHACPMRGRTAARACGSPARSARSPCPCSSGTWRRRPASSPPDGTRSSSSWAPPSRGCPSPSRTTPSRSASPRRGAPPGL